MAAGLPDEKMNLLTRYSSLQKLLRVTACHRWRHSLGIRGDTTVDPGLLTTEKMDLAWIRIVKEAAYKTETQTLLKDKLLNNKTLCRLSIFMDQKDILRVEGRIKHALLAYDEKHPIILPKRSTLVRLIMTSYHSETLHGGMQQTEILGTFWTDVDKKSHTSMSSVCMMRAATPQQVLDDLHLA